MTSWARVWKAEQSSTHAGAVHGSGQGVRVQAWGPETSLGQAAAIPRSSQRPGASCRNVTDKKMATGSSVSRTQLPDDPAVPLPGIDNEALKTHVHTNIGMFTVAENGKQPKSPPMDE